MRGFWILVAFVWLVLLAARIATGKDFEYQSVMMMLCLVLAGIEEVKDR